MHAQLTGWQSGVRSCIAPGLPWHKREKLNVGTVVVYFLVKVEAEHLKNALCFRFCRLAKTTNEAHGFVSPAAFHQSQASYMTYHRMLVFVFKKYKHTCATLSNEHNSLSTVVHVI